MTTQHQQWEYDKKYCSLPHTLSEGDLNRRGEDGWELCGCYPDYGMTEVRGIVYIFKRPKQ